MFLIRELTQRKLFVHFITSIWIRFDAHNQLKLVYEKSFEANNRALIIRIIEDVLKINCLWLFILGLLLIQVD